MKSSLLLGLLLAPVLSAAPFKAASVPASAQWYLHGDLEGLRKTDSGKIILNTLRKENARQLTEATEIFGFDPLADLTDLTLFGDGKANRAAIILSGAMNRVHLEEIIVNAESYTSTAHGEATVHSWDDKGKIQFAAFHGDATVIVSEHKDLVNLSLDVLAGTKPGLPTAPAVAKGNPVLLAVANIHKIDLPMDEGSSIVRKARIAEISLTEINERLRAHLVVKTDSERIAKNLKDALGGLIAIGSLADEKIDDLAIEHDGSAKGDTMDMTMSISVSKALALISELE